jgi:HlyD family secretion protein
MKKLGWRTITIIAVLLVVALIIVGRQFGKKKGVEVEVETTAARTIVAKVSESGVIQPDLEVPIAPDISGEVVAVNVADGDFVRKGQLLFSIRPDNLRAAYEQANASYNSAQADYGNQKAALQNAIQNYMQDSINLARNTPLYNNKVISQQDYENFRLRAQVSKGTIESTRQQVNAAYFRIKSTEASMKQSADQLSRTNVYASMDGTITKMDLQVGKRVVGTNMMAGTEAMKIADLTRMEVAVDITENDIVNVQIGDTAAVEVDAYPDKIFKGKVTEIAYSANVQGAGSTDQVTNYSVKVAILPSSYDKELAKSLPPTRGPFRPGMTAVVRIYTDRAENVVAVPIASVTIEKGKPTGAGKPRFIAFVVEGEKVKSVPVTTGISDDDYIEIKEGLKAGEKVVSGPYTVVNKTLADGMDITIKDKQKGKGKPGKDGEKADSTKKETTKKEGEKKK